ncbi:GntR family transcriptional regulator [Paenarthrobacter sp. NPDC090520]|uniref:GntR family transcriptional regulator n=1 Tax=Paenarthrobacter sp. NPDC090520 TaxID=3364382 RepID=UPI0037FA4B92
MSSSKSSDVEIETASTNGRPSASARAAQSLRQRLAARSWAAGERLPSEPALAEELGVSRVSVRAALAELQSEGLVSRRHGSGTYVNSIRPLVSSLHRNVGSDQLIRSRGHVSGIAGMSWQQMPADEELAERLQINVGDPVIDLYRVRTSDNIPVTVEHDYFSAALLPHETISLGPSLYAFLSEVCGIEVAFGIATLEPAFVGEALMEVFNVPANELCLIIRQVDYDPNERPVSYSVEQHLASAFDFQLVRQGPFVPSAS